MRSHDIPDENLPAEQDTESGAVAIADEENPFADMLPQDMFAAALAEDHQVDTADPTAIAEAVEEVVTGSKGKKKKAEPAAPPRTHALIKIGEYDQEIEIGVFSPWWSQLVAETGGDGFALMNQIKHRLGIAA